ncbi:Protein-glutamine gamma-glutamyltransferase [Andreprevotia sp. IGB-42]|uniref:transglutaminase family protein n=1 Tax=Andreprevotia sp. IGB-42 TaxID=2497473 RepID=UPI0013589B7F|nr:DUF3488 and transglutaminase-like domain-containing protein [Andreprevotia sp. IGB-42]KAF0814233.1 Protein-glutamine gamma-glutamyltransferase [Andreprevotia sp. IGB-42]
MKTALRDDLPRLPLYGLVFALLLALLPHLLQLAPWHAAIVLLPLVWRSWLAWQGKALPARWLRLLYAAVLVGIVLLQFNTLLGRDGGVTLLVSLLAVKLLETRQRRDARVLTLLAFFATSAAFLVSQAFWMLAYAAICAIAIIAQLRSWQRLDGKLDVQEYKRASWMMLEALPVMLLLFFLFPRLSGPLWQMPGNDSGAKIGLADDMSPGSFTDLALDDSVAFRADFEGAQPPRNALYWRGPVFEYFDGRSWQQLLNTQRSTPSYEALSPAFSYSITLEPHNRNWLLALDLPAPGALPQGTRLTSRLQLVSNQPVSQRKRVQMQSVTSWRMTDTNVDLAADLQLPAGGNPRARALAQGWAGLPPPARVEAALNYLRSNGFSYTLDAPLLPGQNTIDDLLFNTREGFCEHYSGAFVFLMRAAGVPARVVAGYLGGEKNADYLIVRQTDAHAWAEVWLDGQGWQRVDPTAVVAPGRITRGIAGSVRGAQNLPYLLRDNAAWLNGIRLRWDAVVYGWNRWVIGYDAQRQLQLFGRLGIDDLASPRLLAWLGGIAVLFLAIYAGLHTLQGRHKRPDAAQRLWLRFLRRLARHQLIPARGEGPADFAARAARAMPAQAAAIHAISTAYLAARYRSDAAAQAELTRLVPPFRP